MAKSHLRHTRRATGGCQRESIAERKCRDIAIRRGYYLLKWTSPGTTGVPDRILIGPGGFIAFCEFKRADTDLTEVQKFWRARLEAHDHSYHVIRTVAEFEQLLR
jgi:hypothetical protein